MEHDKAPPALVQLIQAFNNPFIYVLALALVSFFTDYWMPLRHGEETDLTGVIIIVTMVTLSGLLRFWQEFRTNKAAQALKSMVRTTATVLRRESVQQAPQKQEVDITSPVPGDIIYLSAGDLVPADVRLLDSRDLFISAILTGESLPVENMTLPATWPASRPAPAKRCVAAGTGQRMPDGHQRLQRQRKAVVATGRGNLLRQRRNRLVTAHKTAFDRGVNSVSWLLIRFMLVMVPVVLLINGLTKGDWLDAALFALAVAVGLTPEMLPMIVSSNLAKGAIAMSRRKVIVKRLNAIQNLGAMDILCTDKTGTLTQDNIILEHHLDCAGVENSRVLMLSWLNSHYQSGTPNLMDRAILRYGKGRISADMSDYSKVDELPFDFVRRRVSVVVRDRRLNQQMLICKGAVEEMLSIASAEREGKLIQPLNETRRAELLALAHQYNQQGFRVLLVASRALAEPAQALSVADER